MLKQRYQEKNNPTDMRNTSQELVNEYQKNELEMKSNIELMQRQILEFREQELEWKNKAQELTLLVQAIAKENEELKA